MTCEGSKWKARQCAVNYTAGNVFQQDRQCDFVVGMCILRVALLPDPHAHLTWIECRKQSLTQRGDLQAPLQASASLCPSGVTPFYTASCNEAWSNTSRSVAVFPGSTYALEPESSSSRPLQAICCAHRPCGELSRSRLSKLQTRRQRQYVAVDHSCFRR